MTAKDRKKLLEKAIQHFGINHQKVKAIEEFSELTKEVCKDINYLPINRIELVKEIADCEIMIEQLKMMYNCHRLTDVYKVEKLERLEKLINGQA